jgi:hypothetical protein
MHKYGGSEFGFLAETDEGIAVVLKGSKSPVVWVVKDSVYATMWRVRSLDGRLSAMANKVRAKDAALDHAASAMRVWAETLARRAG